MKQRNKGITLVALVITIVILLIIVGITIGFAFGHNGILTLAQKSGKNYIQAQQEENDTLNNLYSSMMISTNDSSQVTINIKQLLDVMYPVGSVYITTSNTNPQELFGGKWESFGEGRTLIGAGSGTDVNNETVEFVENTTGGEYNHKLTTSEMPSHSHALSDGGNIISVYANKTDTEYNLGFSGMTNGWWRNANKCKTGIASTGGSNSHNNIQPYIVTYMWKRIN